MNTPSEGMLAQRQLRAAEIALETARRRRREIDAELRELEAELAAVQSALAASEAGREQDRVALEEQLALARVGETAAEQRYLAERNRRLSLEQQLTAVARAQTRRDELTRQLAAEARISELEGELELVTRHAAAFEYGVRMAAFDAFRLVRDMTDHVTALLSRTGLVAAPVGERPPEPATPVEPLSVVERAAVVEPVAAVEPVTAAAPVTSRGVAEPQPIAELLPTPVPRPPGESGSRRPLDTFRRIPVPKRAARADPDALPGAGPAAPPPDLTAARPDPAAAPPEPAPYRPPARPRDRDAVRPPSVASVLDAQRLDAALDRLRATTPPPADES